MGEAAPIDDVIAKIGALQQKWILECLAKNVGKPVDRDVLVNAAYGHLKSGGPDDAYKAVGAMIAHIRQKIAPYGWTLLSMNHGRGATGVYKLVPTEAGA